VKSSVDRNRPQGAITTDGTRPGRVPSALNGCETRRRHTSFQRVRRASVSISVRRQRPIAAGLGDGRGAKAWPRGSAGKRCCMMLSVVGTTCVAPPCGSPAACCSAPPPSRNDPGQTLGPVKTQRRSPVTWRSAGGGGDARRRVMPTSTMAGG
jgi:hypothetical protein